VIGGEGNGAVAVPHVQPTHDSAAAIGLLLECLATTGAPLSSLVAELPALTLLKEKVPVAPSLIYSVLQDFREAVGEVPGASVDYTDGVRIAWPDGWVHVRASNTQSLVRLIAEAEGPDRCRELLEWARERLRA
jgi:phosphomannomutase